MKIINKLIFDDDFSSASERNKVTVNLNKHIVKPHLTCKSINTLMEFNRYKINFGS